MRRCLMLIVGAAAALTLVASSADAQTRTLSMSGQWFQNRGPLVDIPLNGGPVLCGAEDLPAGCVNFFAPLNGGIKASNVAVPASGTGPAAFSINNSSAFVHIGGAPNRTTAPVIPIPTVIQLASQFSLMGPGLVTTTGGNGGGTMASFAANNWVSDPQQAARLGANFQWCPALATTGGVLGLCTPTTFATTYGPLNAKFSYTAGPNAFGGTMAMMLRDTAVVSVNIGGTSPGPRVLHQLVGGTTNPTFGPQMGGNRYGAYRMLTLAPGPIFSTFMQAGACGPGGAQDPPGCSLITGQGGFLFSAPSSMNADWGMPWTTGNVVAQVLSGGAGDPATTFSVMGTDSRTPLGKGQITMVAGQVTQRLPTPGVLGNKFAALDYVVLNFGAPQTPLLSGPAIAAMVALMLLAGGYMARRHFATA